MITKNELKNDLNNILNKEYLMCDIAQKLDEKYEDSEMLSSYSNMYKDKYMHFSPNIFDPHFFDGEEIPVYVNIFFDIDSKEIDKRAIQEGLIWIKITDYSYYK